MRAILTVGLLAVAMATPPIQSDMDKLWLARAVQGEVGVMGPLREETGKWIVHTALNRVSSPWFPGNIQDVVRQGFAGAHVVGFPDEWTLEIVKQALEEHRQGEDPTGGALFVFGGQDLTECMDWSSHRGSLQREGWVFSVHLFAEWPFKDSCEN